MVKVKKLVNIWPIGILLVAGAACVLQLQHADRVFRDSLLSKVNERVNLAESNLRQAVNSLAADPALGEHLEWKLDYAVRTLVAGVIVPRVVDGVGVYDDRCQLVAKAGNLANGLCKKTGSQWLGNDALNYVTSLQTKSKKTYVIIAAVTIDKSWLGEQLSDTNGASWPIQLGPTDETRGVSFGNINFANGPRLTMQVSPPRYYAGLIADQPALVILLCLLGVSMLWATKQRRSDRDAWQKKQTAIDHDIRDSVRRLVQDDLDQQLEASSGMHSVVELLTQHQQSLRNERQASAKKIAELDLNLRKNQTVAKSLEKKLDELVNYEAMGLQLTSIMRRLSSDLEQMQSISEDIVDTLVHGASRTLQAQWALLRQWQLDVQSQGVRRVLKQMTETIMFDGATLFEHQLRQFTTLEQQLEDQLVHATGFCQRLEKTSKEADSMSSHWADLIEDSELAKPPTSILEVLLEAQAMVQRAAATQPQFINQLDLNLSVQHLTKAQAIMPRPIWLSVLFHLYMAIAEDVASGAIEMRSTIQQGIDESRLLFSANVDQESALRIRNSAHLDVAERLARRYGMKTALLRAANGNVIATALAWTQEQDPLQHQQSAFSGMGASV